jgi:AraC family transcriptional regulator
LAVESIRVVESGPFKIRFKANSHLLVFTECGVRSEGETHLEGLPTSALKDLSQRLTFVPAGHEYRDQQTPRGTTRIVCVYIDPAALSMLGTVEIGPRLFFRNAALLETVSKLAALVEKLETRPHYLSAIGAVLMHEILRLEDGAERAGPPAKGGLAAWQERAVLTYIDQHLDETITLDTLAALVRLSPFHFCRVFKQTFGVPPHRFHMLRRIEKAKELLAEPNPSVTQIGLQLGFSETSSFTATFRKSTGLTPTAYRRSLTF